MVAHYATSDPRRHIVRVRNMLNEVNRYLTQDTVKVTDPEVRAMFETTAEVLSGLARDYEQAEKKAAPGDFTRAMPAKGVRDPDFPH